MDHGLRGQRGNIFILFPFHSSITIWIGVILLITNRVNKQIILQTKVGIIVILKSDYQGKKNMS